MLNFRRVHSFETLSVERRNALQCGGFKYFFFMLTNIFSTGLKPPTSLFSLDTCHLFDHALPSGGAGAVVSGVARQCLGVYDMERAGWETGCCCCCCCCR